MSLALHSAVVTDPGLIRSNNEDSAFAGARLIVVADGIGGLPAGELASDIVIRGVRDLDAKLPDGDPERVLRIAVAAANDEIQIVADEDPDRYGMGTTCTAMLLVDDQIFLAHVGDSRGYLLHDGAFTQVTVDDTYVQMLVDAGEIDRVEARHHPQRSLVMQALQGGGYELHTEVWAPTVGDRLLVCSDGLSDVITDDTIAAVLGMHPDVEECAQTLVKLTLAAGAPDNVTVIVADVVDA
jgi:serine/threonine protein phosphatase PrpC